MLSNRGEGKMDNKNTIKDIKDFTIKKYLKKLLTLKIKTVTLFSVFPHTAAPNISDGHTFALIENPQMIASLNGPHSKN